MCQQGWGGVQKCPVDPSFDIGGSRNWVLVLFCEFLLKMRRNYNIYTMSQEGGGVSSSAPIDKKFSCRLVRCICQIVVDLSGTKLNINRADDR